MARRPVPSARRPDLPAAHSAVPDTGTEVWIDFDSGDPTYPIRVGVA
jgi:hypothetical protein